MAFTTQTGNPSTIQGTNEVDVLASTNLSSRFVVYADDADDGISLVSTSSTILTDVSVYGQDGDDTINGVSQIVGSSIIQGGDGDDDITITGNLLSGAIVRGGADDDTITINYVANSTVNGSAGFDTLFVDGTLGDGARVYGGSDNDIIFIDDGATLQDSKINGSAGADIIRGVVAGGAIAASTGATFDEATLHGGSGADTFRTTTDAGVDDDGAGFNNAYLTGDAGADIFAMTWSDEYTLSGGLGDDTIGLDFDDDDGVTDAYTATVSGGVGNDAYDFETGDGSRAGSVTVMQGREDSTAATATAGGATVVDNTTTITYADGIDTITNFDAVDADLLGLELATTAANLFVTADALGLTLSTGFSAGNTYQILGDWNAATRTFTVDSDQLLGNTDATLVIMGDGNALTANASAFLIFGTGLILNAADFTTYAAV